MRYLEIKPGSLEEAIKRTDEDYQALFKKELKKTGKSIPQMTPDEKKAFFNKIDKMHAAKNEAKVDELTKAQKKLPPALQKAIKKKEMKEEEVPANVKKIAKELDKAVDMHKSQAKRLRKAGIDEGKMSQIASYIDDIANAMSKDSMTKPFITKFKADAAKSLNPSKSLEKILPDYVPGAKIAKLLNMGEEKLDEMRKVEIKLHPQNIDKTIQKIQKHIDIVNKGRGTQIDVIQNMSNDSVTIDGRSASVDREIKDIRNFIGFKSARVVESVAKDNKVAQLKTKLSKEKDTDALEAQVTDLKGQIALLKTQLENEKNKAVKPEPNPDTGEVPLTVGVAYKHLRDKMKKESDKKKTAIGTKPSKINTKPEVEFDR